MRAATRAPGHPLADLALALATAATTRVEAVPETGARAAAELIGDCAGIRLVSDDGRWGPLVTYPPGEDHLTRLLDGPAGDVWAARLLTSREPIIPSIEDAVLVLCPLLAGQACLGYLALARTTPGGRYVEADLDLSRDIAGEVALALTTARSIDLVRVTEERFRRIVDTALEGVWQLDADGVTTSVNKRMAEMLGLSREQLPGMAIGGFLDEHSRAELPRWLAAPGTRDPAVHKARLLCADGTVRWVQVAAAPLPGHQDDPGGTLCMITDITDQEQARGLKRQLDHLRRLDSLGQLIGGIAHDFNNLLTVIAGTAEVIAGGAEPGSGAERLALEIAEATVRGRTLAHQLLAFGRGGGRLETVPVPDLLESVTQLLNRTIGEHIRLDIQVDDDVWPVRTERGPLEQVLVNLAANARDAMPRGGVLTIRVGNAVEPGESGDDAGRFVRLTVTDTGAGMDRQTRQRAFEPFFTTKPTAAGLGLATAASILRAGGGHIRLQSELRIGTTVELLLPAADRPAATVPDAATTDRPAGGHILVVEDQPELAQLIRYLLEPAGYTVTVATDPQAALAAEMRPDLLLTDVVMPGMTGPELAATLRERHPEMRVLYTSGYAPSVLGPQAHIDDDSGLIQKPFNREALLTAIRRAWR
jgi:two-component system cell cycle sensor histidine kinase/response regulator CckA